jgi:two-component sensor histidine kinase
MDLVWQERGGPPVSPSTRKGFGLSFIEGMMGDLKGTASPQFSETGVEWRLVFPLH